MSMPMATYAPAAQHNDLEMPLAASMPITASAAASQQHELLMSNTAIATMPTIRAESVTAEMYPQHLLGQQQIYMQPQTTLFVDNTHPLMYVAGHHSYMLDRAQPTCCGQQVSYVNAPQAYYVGSPASPVMHQGLESSQSLAYVALPSTGPAQDGVQSPQPMACAMDGQPVYFSEHGETGYFTADGHPVHYFTEGQPVASSDIPVNSYYLPYVTEEDPLEAMPHDLATDAFQVMQAGDNDLAEGALANSLEEGQPITHVSQPHELYTTEEGFPLPAKSSVMSVAPAQYVTQSDLPSDTYPARGRKVYNISPEQFEILCSGSSDATALAQMLQEHPDCNVDATFGQMLCHQAFVAGSLEQLDEETELLKLAEDSDVPLDERDEAAVFTELSTLSNPVYSEARPAFESQNPAETEAIEESQVVDLNLCATSPSLAQEALCGPDAAAEKPDEVCETQEQTTEELVAEASDVATAADVKAAQPASPTMDEVATAPAGKVSQAEGSIVSDQAPNSQTAVPTDESAASSKKATTMPLRLKARPTLKKRSCC